MPRMTQADKIWRANYWYRVWYNAIPGLPDDQVTLSKIGSTWNSAFPKDSKFQLGNIYAIGERLQGFNDIENMLSADTGLLHAKQFRIFRQFKNQEHWFTDEEWEKLKQEDRELWSAKHERMRQGLPELEIESNFHIIRSQKIRLKDVGNNNLHFGDNDIVRMSAAEISLSETTYQTETETLARHAHHRFPNIYQLLVNTELPQPPSDAALPRPRAVTTRQYQKFLDLCPAYMSSYKEKLVEEAE